MSESLISFTKMHGLGNDFMVLERITQSFELNPKLVRLLGDRHLGVGFDQLLLVEAPQRPDADFTYRIYNSDGAEVEQCGNGARCFARFVVERGLSFKRKLAVETAGGLIYLHITDSGVRHWCLCGRGGWGSDGAAQSGRTRSGPVVRWPYAN